MGESSGVGDADSELREVLRGIVVSACTLTGASAGELALHHADGALSGAITHRTVTADPKHRRGLRSHGTEAAGSVADVRVRGAVQGELRVWGRSTGFTDHDRVVLDTLAGTAGVILGHARAYALSEQRRRLLEATTLVAEALQPPVRLDEAFGQVVLGARVLTGAIAAAVVHLLPDGVQIAAGGGPAMQQIRALLDADEAQLREPGSGARIVVRGRDTWVLVPLRAHLAHPGVLVLAVDPTHRIDDGELEVLTAYGDQASLSLDRAQALVDRRELLLTADRERIARDLHDVVIQRLFATGLQLQGARRLTADPDVISRLDGAVNELDVTIREIRASIFELQNRQQASLRTDLTSLAREYAATLGFVPTLRTVGPLDLNVTPTAAAQLMTVLREALSNVARHARAGSCEIEVSADEHWLQLLVTDDGVGLPPERQESGLRNARTRAVEAGGTLTLGAGTSGGARLTWRIPVDA